MILVAVAWIIFVLTTFLLFNDNVKAKLLVVGVDIVISYASAIITAVLGFAINDDVQLSTLPLTL